MLVDFELLEIALIEPDKCISRIVFLLSRCIFLIRTLWYLYLDLSLINRVYLQYNTQITQNTLLKMRQLFTRQNTSSFYSFLSCILTCVIYYNEKISSVLGNILAVLWWLMRNRELWSVLVFTCLHAKHIKNCLLKNDCLSVCFIKKLICFPLWQI